jgi:alanine-glyoxylate transaminase/serine-glyoxylate transaminase/serine-pyruvate transaminase
MQNYVKKGRSMLQLDLHPTGRHFLQIPGPSPVPDRILRAISLPTIDHRGPEFGVLGLKVLSGIQKIFQTRHPVAIYPASGTGAWEAALSNTLSAGDHVLMFETGHFASVWACRPNSCRGKERTRICRWPGAGAVGCRRT